MKTPSGFFRAYPLLLALCVAPAASEAATLAGNVTPSVTGSVDLTSTGSTNWAVWNYGSGTSGNSLAASNSKSGGPGSSSVSGYISGLTRVGSTGGTNIRGGNATVIQFGYSDGVSSSSFGPAVSGIVFPSNLDQANQGVRLSVTGDPTQTYQVSVWAGGLAGVGTMTASLNGVTDLVLLSQTYTTTDTANGSKGATLFTYTFRPDSITDTLNLSYILSTDTAGANSSHVGISAVTVSVVPEASTSLSLIAGLGVFGLLRRRS